MVWLDVRGLPGESVADRVLRRLGEQGIEVSAGMGWVPIAAEGAARFGGSRLTIVKRSEEGGFLAPQPLSFLTDDEHLLSLLEGSGVHSCGELGALSAEAVEVRFGAEGVRIWRLTRGDDPRILFQPIPAERPYASIDFVDYTVRDATRLVFTLNALLGQVCGMMRERGHRARSMSLSFSLSGGTTLRETLRTARPTADRALWMRRLRAALERIKLNDAIAGVALEVYATEAISAFQGDLFDRGFATAASVEEGVARLLDLYPSLFVKQSSSRHPLAERRTRWLEVTPEEVAEGGSGETEEVTSSEVLVNDRNSRGERLASTDWQRVTGNREALPALELQLLPEPRPIRVRTRPRRDHLLPTRYFEGAEWHPLTSAGPDRVSGGHEDKRPYAREYYRCVNDSGTLLWIYRDVLQGGWYLHGWWG